MIDGQIGNMTAVLTPLILGSLLWSAAGLAAFPREIWDTDAFALTWPVATLLTAAFGYIWPRHALRHAGLTFGPLVVVMLITGVLTGGSFSLLPIGLIAMLVLALPGAVLAAVAGWIANRGQPHRAG